MKTIVEIEWDQPEDQNWLNPFNIEYALSTACRNTRFSVRRHECASSPFRCVCGEEFSTSDSLARHQSTCVKLIAASGLFETPVSVEA